jgi:16S rRNA (adenine1518-N6/adenine1519-N6)-dimethyltransferase
VPETRQTLSYLRTLLQERGVKPKNKLGQNFLVDLNLLDVLLDAAELSRADLALEVGSGTGSLTVRLIERAGAVLSVELDPAFASLTEETVANCFPAGTPHVRLMHVDVLKNKNEINPAVMQALGELAAQSAAARMKLVANLPYAVAVPVITNLLLSDANVERMVVTVQWEIAERLLSRPGAKEHAALAVLVQSLAEASLLRRLPPPVFWPRPQVDSAIVLIRPDPAKRARVVERAGDVQRFRNFLRDLYVHRRKNLRGGLVSRPGARLDKQEVDRKLNDLGLDGTTRAEALDLEQHLRLCEAFG